MFQGREKRRLIRLKKKEDKEEMHNAIENFLQQFFQNNAMKLNDLNVKISKQNLYILIAIALLIAISTNIYSYLKF